MTFRGRIHTITRIVLITLTTEARPEELPGDMACTTVALRQDPTEALLPLKELVQVVTTGLMIMVLLEVVLTGERLLRTKTTLLHRGIEACHLQIGDREVPFERR